MNATEPQTLVLAAVLILGVIAAAVLIVRQQRARRSMHLQQRFGPEYNRVVRTAGTQEKAEAELQAREQRVERLKLVPLPSAEAARFSEAWAKLQARFVDNPNGVVGEADRLIRELMAKRGYPMGDFERRAADISVHHPAVVEHYRAAQAIALRDERGEASTEELRKAVVHYRALFDDLLAVGAPAPSTNSAAVARKEEALHS